MNITIENVFKNIMNSRFIPMDKTERELFANAEESTLINTTEGQAEFMITKDGSEFELFTLSDDCEFDITVHVHTTHYQTTLFPIKNVDGEVKTIGKNKGHVWNVEMEVYGLESEPRKESATFFVNDEES